jgi:hypothetical protein
LDGHEDRLFRTRTPNKGNADAALRQVDQPRFARFESWRDRLPANASTLKT